MRQFCVFLAIAMPLNTLCHAVVAQACTSGGAMKAATPDGRPIIWQNMDWNDHKVVLHKYEGTGTECDVLEVVKYPAVIGWNGLNSEGMAYVVNKLAAFGPNGNMGDVVRNVTRESRTLAEFETYLATRGAQTVGENFLVMDRSGRIVDYEIGPTYHYPYDPENASRQQQSYFEPPKLFVTRANEPFRNDIHQEPDAVVEAWPYGSTKFRYTTARTLFQQKIMDGDKLTLWDVMSISRQGNPGFDSYAICSPPTAYLGTYSIWSTIVLGVKPGDNPSFATLVVALGIPDYSIFVPAWVDLSQTELNEHVKTWDDSNVAWWSYKLYEERFDDTADYDEYVRDVFSAVEDNILDAVLAARHQWLVVGNVRNAHQEMKNMHNYAAYAAYFTIKSAYATAAGGVGTRNCNYPPTITSLGATNNGLEVSFAHDASDPDAGDTVTFQRWRFGDGGTVADTATPTHTYSQPGTYQVMAYVGTGSGTRYAANVKFEYVTVSSSASCGDESCNGSETCASCPGDCGACCGDGLCIASQSEDCEVCPADCPTPIDHVCCDGAVWPGDCCGDDDCNSPDTCVGYTCLPPSTCESDADGDQYGVGASCAGADCDDTDPAIHPGAVERCNGLDDDCDGVPDEDWVDLGEACSVGVGACESAGVVICGAGEAETTCDAVPAAPSLEDCSNGADDDCDGAIDVEDDDCATCVDADGDGHGLRSCGGDDCNDDDPEISPTAVELCGDKVDNNCDGLVDAQDDACAADVMVGGCNAMRPIGWWMTLAGLSAFTRRRRPLASKHRNL